jgi:hypothetical protein
MAESQADHGRQATPGAPPLDIIVKEAPVYPWPPALSAKRFGNIEHPHLWHFRIFLKLIELARPTYSWKYFYLNRSSGLSHLADYDELIQQLERLFQDELGSPFSEEQLNLLLTSQLVVVVVDKKSGTIAGYSSSSYVPRNSITGINRPLSLGNHCVIAADHQQHKIGMFMAAVSMLHGQRLPDLFRNVFCVLRTNNRYVYLPMKQTGPTFRSDKLSHTNLTEDEQRARLAISHMHNEVFRLYNIELPFDRPLDIKHNFDPAVTIDGVNSNQIIYVFGITIPVRGIFTLLARRSRRKEQR